MTVKMPEKFKHKGASVHAHKAKPTCFVQGCKKPPSPGAKMCVDHEWKPLTSIPLSRLMAGRA